MPPDEPAPVTTEPPVSPPPAPESPPPPPAEKPEPAAETKPETKPETKETLLEAVTRVVKPADDEDEGERPADVKEQPATQPKEGEKGEPDPIGDPTPEELESYPYKTRKRVRDLLQQRDSFKAEAEVTRTLRDFLVINDIAREDFQLTLDLAAAMRRGDFKAFLTGVGPYVQLATQALGMTLPPDLAAEVQQGRVNHEAASQISRERYARALAEQRANRATEVLQSRQNVEQNTNFARSIEQTVTQWEQGVRATDPDYGRKEETVRNFLWSVVHEQGAPQSPQHAVEIAQEAYRRANEAVRQWGPQPRATRPGPSSINRSASGSTRAEPKSMMEAALLGLERARTRL